MFVKNDKYKQRELFSFESQMNARQFKLWKGSFEYHFHHLFFSKLDEGIFSVLYSTEKNRPNTPINQLVGSLVLMHRKGWTYEELVQNLNFNMLTRMSLGVWDAHSKVFCERTLFHFQERLSQHWLSEGTNLLEQVFDRFSEAELKRLNLKTAIQRGDSFLAASNVAHFSRLRLVIEVLRRLHRVLSASDQAQYASLFAPYLSQSSSNYVYSVGGPKVMDELAQLGLIYHQLYPALSPQYGDLAVFAVFKRVWEENFECVEQEVSVKPNSELGSNSLQSPDDMEATFRQKGKQKSNGSVIHLSETAHPDNPIQLLTDVSVSPNNVDDPQILEQRIEKMKAKSPDLEEYHTDGGYGGPETDKKMEAENITHVQTSIRGQRPPVELQIHAMELCDEPAYEVHCQHGQKVKATHTPTRFKATFDREICQECPLRESCQTRTDAKGNRYLYFDRADALKHQRWRNITQLPLQRRKLRPNVEASVRQMKSNMKNNKLKVRGLFKAMLYAYLTAIATNMARVAQFEREKARKFAEKTALRLNRCYQLVKELVCYMILHLASHSQKQIRRNRTF
jgi:hypothetical protein